MKENFETKQNNIGLLREKIRILLVSEVDPLEDKEFSGFVSRHFFTEGDVQKVIDEEKERLQQEKAKKEKERHYLRKER